MPAIWITSEHASSQPDYEAVVLSVGAMLLKAQPSPAVVVTQVVTQTWSTNREKASFTNKGENFLKKSNRHGSLDLYY